MLFDFYIASSKSLWQVGFLKLQSNLIHSWLSPYFCSSLLMNGLILKNMGPSQDITIKGGLLQNSANWICYGRFSADFAGHPQFQPLLPIAQVVVIQRCSCPTRLQSWPYGKHPILAYKADTDRSLGWIQLFQHKLPNFVAVKRV